MFGGTVFHHYGDITYFNPHRFCSFIKNERSKLHNNFQSDAYFAINWLNFMFTHHQWKKNFMSLIAIRFASSIEMWALLQSQWQRQSTLKPELSIILLVIVNWCKFSATHAIGKTRTYTLPFQFLIGLIACSGLEWMVHQAHIKVCEENIMKFDHNECFLASTVHVINSVWGGFEMWMIFVTSLPLEHHFMNIQKKVSQSAEHFTPQQTRAAAAQIKLTIFLSRDCIMHIVSCAWRLEELKYTER